MKSILITGGTGFLGSHTCITLLENNYKVIIYDSLFNSALSSLRRIRAIIGKKNPSNLHNLEFVKGDIRNFEALDNLFLKYEKINEPIEAVIHFAGLKAVRESIKEPLSYWENNIIGSITLLRVMDKYTCNKIIFSSSATVYALKNTSLKESDSLNPINPYGNTKLTIEKILNDLFLSSPQKWKICNLRYFNPIGAHSSGMIGEDPSGEANNIFPLILKVASKIQNKLNIYGGDWDTHDGTCIRDFIHVMDVAYGHYLALKYLFDEAKGYISINLGTGIGTSILDLIKTFEDVNNVIVPYEFCERREGDPAVLIADNTECKRTLNWVPRKTLKEMCKDGWKWQIFCQNNLSN